MFVMFKTNVTIAITIYNFDLDTITYDLEEYKSSRIINTNIKRNINEKIGIPRHKSNLALGSNIIKTLTKDRPLYSSVETAFILLLIQLRRHTLTLFIQNVLRYMLYS